MSTLHGTQLHTPAVAPGVCSPAVGSWMGSLATRPPRASRRCRRWRQAVAPPGLSDDGCCNPCEPYQGGNNSVSNDGRPAGPGQLEAKAAVDDAQCDCNPADPDMGVRKGSTASETLKPEMMEPSQCRLEKENHQYDDANDWVRVCLGDRKLGFTMSCGRCGSDISRGLNSPEIFHPVECGPSVQGRYREPQLI